ncbi:MAG: hypothetical protein HY232_16910 [Acidobacteria bacterium]|nr:hypothetical protein [Acidobacteriota bacterium]
METISKLFWMGMLAIMGTVYAQAAPSSNRVAFTDGESAGEEVPRECGGFYYPSVGRSCNFRCQEGDYISVSGNTFLYYAGGCTYCSKGVDVYLSLRVSCGGVTVECSSSSGCGSCQRISDEIAASDDMNGTCEVVGGTVEIYPAAA